MSRGRKKSGSRLSLPWERGDGFLFAPGTGQLWPLLGAVLLVGFLTGVHFVGKRRADVLKTRAALFEVERATRSFVRDIGRCPHGPSELVHPPRSGTQYLSEVPLDAWNRPIRVRCAPGDAVSIEALSAGPSGSFFDDDNVM